jgi:gamma-glutamylcyclotransferase (GGCT)/AIG2-like uncharacterized protein YtfP
MDGTWESRQLLFVYGSLLLPTGDAAVDGAMAKTQSLGMGYILGRLYDLGEYPGAKYCPQGEAKLPPKVWGRLLGISEPGPVFAVLDRYEGFNRAAPLESEFSRSTTAVVLPEEERTVMAQVYFYNPHVRGKKLISGGDFLAYRHGKELRR